MPAEPRRAPGGRDEVRGRPAGVLRRGAGEGPGRRRRDHLLHLGHDRRAQGRAALAPEPPGDRAPRGRRRRRRRGRGDPLVPADGVGGRPHLFLRTGDRGRVHDQLPGERVDGAARPEGDRPDLLLRAAAHLGEHPHERDGPHRGLRVAEAAARPPLPRARTGDRARAPRPPARSRLAPAPLPARAAPRLRAPPRQPRHATRPSRLHGGRGDRPRDLRLLPRPRRQREADLRHDRGERVPHDPAGRRRPARHRGLTDPGRRAAHLAGGRGPLPEPRRLPGL